MKQGNAQGRIGTLVAAIVLLVAVDVVASEPFLLGGDFERRIADDLVAAQSGSAAAIARIAEATDEAVAADPEDAEARVWQGASRVLQAAVAVNQGEPGRGIELFQQGLAIMEEAVEAAADDVTVRAARGRFLVSVIDYLPPFLTTGPARSIVADFTFVIEELGDRLSELPTDEQATLLLGMAEVSAEPLRNWDQVERYARRVVETLPDTRYARRAHELLAHTVGELDENERIRGFVILWSEVRYNFAHFGNVPDLDWDQVFADYLPKVREAETLEEYYRVLQHCVALLRDGHTDVAMPMSRVGWSRPGVVVRPVEGRAVVTAVAENMDGLSVGDAITHVDGESVEQRLEQMYPRIPEFTPQGRDLRAYVRLLDGPADQPVTVRALSATGDEREVTLAREWSPPPPPAREAIAAEVVPERYAYIWIPSFRGEPDVVAAFEEKFPQILEADGLIIDVRGNGGGSGFLGNQIIRRLIDQPIDGLRSRTRVHRPGNLMLDSPATFDEFQGRLSPAQPPHYTGPIVLLTDAATGSAAEDFVATLHGAERATVIGQSTNGSTGQIIARYLPGGITLRVCTRDTRYADGRRYIGKGIQPDVEIAPTQQDIAEGNDPVLRRAVDYLNASAR